MCVQVSAHFDMFNMETCTIWPLCEILGSHSAVVENSGLQGSDARSGIDNHSVASPLTTTTQYLGLQCHY